MYMYVSVCRIYVFTIPTAKIFQMIILISNYYSSSYINSDLDIKIVTYLKALKVLCSLLALQVMLRKSFSVL